MKKWITVALCLLCLSVPARAVEMTAPEAPDSAQALMPGQSGGFGADLVYILRSAFSSVRPQVRNCLRTCSRIFAALMVMSIVGPLQAGSFDAVRLVGVAVVAGLLLEPSHALISDGVQTVRQLSEYGKLLLPVLTATLAAQGGGGSAAALYSATALLNALLGQLICGILVPALYAFLLLSVAAAATGQELLCRLRQSVLNLSGKALRTVVYVFTGYLSITGVVTGAADQMTLKATKLTISGMVPVVGGIMADASETILISAGIVKSTAGIAGLLTVIAIGIEPFLRIGVQYLSLKAMAAVSPVFAGKEVSGLLGDFSGAMGLLLAMTGCECLFILISTICFMKGVG